MISDSLEFRAFFAVLLKPQSENFKSSQSFSSDLRKVQSDYASLFSSKLSKRLPLQRNRDFCVDLETDAASKTKGIHRLSVEELEDLRH